MGNLKFFAFFAVGVILVTIGLGIEETSTYSKDEIATLTARNLQRQITQLQSEAELILEKNGRGWNTARLSFFLMDSVSVLNWNKNDFVPDVHTVQDDFEMRLLQWPRGIFLLKKWRVDSGRFLLGVVPLQDRYKINNRYLVSGWNREIFPTSDISISEQGTDALPIVCNGKIVFWMQVNSGVISETRSAPWVWGLIGAGILFFLAGIYYLASRLHHSRKIGLAFGSLLIFFVGGRILSLALIPSPEGDLFDPTFFASSAYNRSIGDLLINSLVLLVPIGYLFFNFNRLDWVRYVYNSPRAVKPIVSVVLLLLCYFSVLYPFLFFETIFHNSSIDLDITQSIQFNAVRSVAFLSVVIGIISSFLLFHVFIQMNRLLVGRKKSLFLLHLAFAAALFFAFYQLTGREYLITLLTASVLMVVVVLLNLRKQVLKTGFATFLYVFVAIIAFASQGSWSVWKFMEENKVNAQIRFANAFLTDRDYLGEYLLGESVQRISSDPFIQTRLGSPFLGKAPVRQKVKQVYLNSYFDRYDVKIHLFNSSGNSFDNSTELQFADLIRNFELSAGKTNYEGVLFLRNPKSESSKRYLAVIPVNRFGMVTGYIVLDLSLKRVIPRNVFPELLLDDRFLQYFKDKDFSYASFAGSNLLNSFGDFNYDRDFHASKLEDELLYSQGAKSNGFLHVGIKDDSGRVTIVSSPAYAYRDLATNFAFLFTIGLNLVLVVLLIYGIHTWYSSKQLNYSARIQLYVYLAFVLPLYVVSGTTVGLISSSAEVQLNDEYIEKSKVIGERLAQSLDTLKSIDLSSGQFDNQLIELARMANVDASLFSPSGKLLGSSQPLIYEDRILSSLINRDAFERIVNDNEQSFINSEQIGLLNYNSSYYGLRSPDSGNLIGILSLPFFESAYSLERTQITVVANILMIFVAVFILFLVASYFAVQWLTFPLEFITRTLRRTTFTGSNQQLTWKSNDEIGLMVSEYNKMVENLERSRVDLSRIQKESAWREIAKQVAHEVKNPLTPMKLTIQQMEKSLRDGNLSGERTSQSLQTLLQQVEILNEIASSFSAFARMPAPILRRVEIISLVKQVVGLHSDIKEGSVAFTPKVDKIHVMGDEQLLSRVFSNIIINGLQSGEEGMKVHMDVGVLVKDNRCVISFRDNGKGIEDDLIDKIFLPHFSTKKTGSGIGLAIAKQGVEQNGGSIRFETAKGVGTTFYIEIPIV